MTPTRQLLDVKLDGELDAIVAAARAKGDSWYTISFDLQTRTGTEVSHESLRRWFAVAS